MTSCPLLSSGSSQSQVGVRAGHRNCKTPHFFGDSLKDRTLPVHGGSSQPGTVTTPAPHPQRNPQARPMDPILLMGKPRHRNAKFCLKSYSGRGHGPPCLRGPVPGWSDSSSVARAQSLRQAFLTWWFFKNPKPSLRYSPGAHTYLHCSIGSLPNGILCATVVCTAPIISHEMVQCPS